MTLMMTKGFALLEYQLHVLVDRVEVGGVSGTGRRAVGVHEVHVAVDLLVVVLDVDVLADVLGVDGGPAWKAAWWTGSACAWAWGWLALRTRETSVRGGTGGGNSEKCMSVYKYSSVCCCCGLHFEV